MVLLIPIGETVGHVGLQQDCWHDTTNLSCCGDQECKRRLHCQLHNVEAEYYSASEMAVEITFQLSTNHQVSQLDTKHGLTTRR